MKPCFGHRSRIMHKAWERVEFGVGYRFRESLGFEKWSIGHPGKYRPKYSMRPYFAYQRRAENNGDASR